MTERGPFTGMRGAPGPAEPSKTGDPPAATGGTQPIPALPADLSAVRRTDAILDSLAARRAAGTAPRPATGSTAGAECGSDGAADGSDGGTDGAAEGCRQRQTDEPDPAVRLLRALITDVDEQVPETEADTSSTTGPPSPPAPSGPGSGPRRRGPRTIVALGVAGAVLASTGVAAAGDGVSDRSVAAPPPASTSGVRGAVEKTVSTDADAGFHDDWRAVPVPPPGAGPTRVAPVRAVPEADRPAARKPPADRREHSPTRTTPRNPFPYRPPVRTEDAPVNAYSPPRGENEPSGSYGAPGYGPPPSEGRPAGDDVGERPEQRPDRYRHQHRDRRHHHRRG